MKPKWTIGICTWNRAELLDQTLASVNQLVGIGDPKNPVEVIIVNNGSTDETVELLDSYYPPCQLRVVLEPQLGHTHARNRLVKEAAGDFILWTDDDVILEHHWLQNYQKAILAKDGSSFWGGPITPKFLGRTPLWIQRNFKELAGCFALRDLGSEQIEFSRDRLPYGANFAVKTSVAREFPFSSHLGRKGTGCVGDDERDFLLRLLADGHTGFWIPDAKVDHLIPESRANLAYIRNYFAGQAEVQFLNDAAPDWSHEAFTNAARHHKTWLRLTRWSTPSRIWLNHVIKEAQFQRWAELTD